MLSSNCKRNLGTLLLFLIIGVTTSPIYAEIPRSMNYQGYLKDQNEVPIEGTVTMKFCIWDGETGGAAPLWAETLSVEIKEGIYSVILGLTVPINLPFDVPYYLGVTIGTDEEMAPRQPLSSVPYALNTELQSETDPTVPESLKDGVSWNEVTDRPSGLDDGDDLGLEEETDPEVGTNVMGYVAKWTGAALEKGTIYDNGNVGIGTAAPNSKLEVAGVIHSTTGGVKFPDGTTQVSAAAGGSSPWNTSGSNVYYEAGNVGIGDLNPAAKLTVKTSEQGVDGILAVNGTKSVRLLPNAGQGTFNGLIQAGDAAIVFSAGQPDTGNLVIGNWANGYSGIRMTSDGNLGIGISEPKAKLESFSENPTNTPNLILRSGQDRTPQIRFNGPWSVLNPQESYAMIMAKNDNGGLGDSASSLRFHTTSGDPAELTEKMIILGKGNVGIGITNPVSKLEVDAKSDWDITISGPEDTYKDLRFADSTSGRIWQWSHRTSADNNRFQLWHHDGTSWQSPPISVLTSGHIGINTSSPQKRLQVNGDLGLGNSYDTEFPDYGYGPPAIKRFSIWDNYGGQTNPVLGTMRSDDGESFAEMAFFSKAHGSVPRALACRWGTLGTGGEETWYIGTFGSAYFAGNMGIGTNAPAEKLHVKGNTLTEGMTTTTSLKITGGADIAEPFKIKKNHAIKPGMVVSIDPENPGELKLSDKAYDHCVAGIVSGAGGINAGMIMSQTESEGDDSQLVALTGRAYCYCDASNNSIRPGDLLTSSEIPGHAMKVVDFAGAQGAVIGKAMTALDSGKGLVLVLVALQ